jgi:hypothetical protein
VKELAQLLAEKNYFEVSIFSEWIVASNVALDTSLSVARHDVSLPSAFQPGAVSW